MIGIVTRAESWARLERRPVAVMNPAIITGSPMNSRDSPSPSPPGGGTRSCTVGDGACSADSAFPSCTRTFGAIFAM